MNLTFGRINKLSHHARNPLLLFVAAAWFIAWPVRAADSDLGQKAKDVARDTSEAVERAANSVADSAKDFWHRIEPARVKNRTPDEIVAWVIMGVLVGLLAGTVTGLKPGGLGNLGRLALGLAGAFVGGIIVHAGRFDFGWGPVLIRYEELFFSLVGAVVLLVVGKIVSGRMKKRSSR